MKQRKPLTRDQNDQTLMSKKNIQICLNNQELFYETHELNEVLHLQYYGFSQINNLQTFINLNTLYLNNNAISKIQHLQRLAQLVTLNLSHNRIEKIQNLQMLTKLVILDLSNNKIKFIQQLYHLKHLSTLNLSGNLLVGYSNLQQLTLLETVTSLDLSNNQIQADQNLFQIFKAIPTLTVLYLRNTPFIKGTSNYRKNIIYHIPLLVYLDDRPVTSDQRQLVTAWKQGGLQNQKIIKNNLLEKKLNKQKRQYNQMSQTIQKVQQLRKQLFENLTKIQRIQLDTLTKQKHQRRSNLSPEQYDILCLKIRQLEHYLQIIKQEVKSMSVGPKPEIKMIIEKDTPQAIYVYNVQQEDFNAVKDKFFGEEETRPIIFVNQDKQIEKRWVSDYDNILAELYQQYRQIGKLLPLFNMKIHEFDSLTRRKPRRFTFEQISTKVQQRFSSNSQTRPTHQLDQLD